MLIKFIISVVLLNLINYSASDQPPYQVSIWLRWDLDQFPNSTPVCYGIVIHERLILTPADCMQYKEVIGTRIVNSPISATDLVVVAGSAQSPSATEVIVNVTSIDIYMNFDSNTMENDLALLKLNESLPLAMRKDIQWISLDDHNDYKNSTCTVSFYNSRFSKKNIKQTHDIVLMSNDNCTNTTTFQSPRTEDICSLYLSETTSVCNLTVNDLITSADRGAGLVCDSKLIGFLSEIIPRDYTQGCEDTDMLNAIYTRVASYLNWIYEKIAMESMADLGKANHVMAPPYKESAPSPNIQVTSSEDFSTTPLTTTSAEHKEETTTTTRMPTVAPTIEIHTTPMPHETTTTTSRPSSSPNEHQTYEKGNNAYAATISYLVLALTMTFTLFF